MLCIVYRQSPLGPVDPSFRALSGRLQFTVRRHKFNKYSLLRSAKGTWRGRGSGCCQTPSGMQPPPRPLPLRMAHICQGGEGILWGNGRGLQNLMPDWRKKLSETNIPSGGVTLAFSTKKNPCRKRRRLQTPRRNSLLWPPYRIAGASCRSIEWQVYRIAGASCRSKQF